MARTRMSTAIATTHADAALVFTSDLPRRALCVRNRSRRPFCKRARLGPARACPLLPASTFPAHQTGTVIPPCSSLRPGGFSRSIARAAPTTGCVPAKTATAGSSRVRTTSLYANARAVQALGADRRNSRHAGTARRACDVVRGGLRAWRLAPTGIHSPLLRPLFHNCYIYSGPASGPP